MKTKILIQLLQEADPTGEEECCVDNADISYVGSEPAYYDGCLQIIERDTNGCAISGRRRRTGLKINISHDSIGSCIDSDPDFPIHYDPDTERYREADDARRVKIKKMLHELERENFQDWAFQRAQKVRTLSIGAAKNILGKVSSAFFDQEGLSRSSPIQCWIDTPDGTKHISYIEARHAQWDDLYQISYGNTWVIERKV